VKELEDEFHDSDDELPEDAIIFNIPISPRPPHERESLSRRSSPPGSASHSPVAPAHKGLGIAMPNPDVEANMSKGPPPKSPRHSMVARSVSMTSIPEDYAMDPRSAGKTWDNALSELSNDARTLTQILETHAERQEREQEEKVQAGSPRKRNSSEKRRFSSSTIELPPMRKHETLLIDPLPISKEKEKFLTRTRPSWLPPKDPEEEKRHLKEYQKMMAKAKQTEMQKEKKQHQEKCLRDTTKESLGRVWDQHVLPNWDNAILEPRTRELWWKGIKPRDRGNVWQKAVGNDLGLSDASYIAALRRAKEAHNRLSKLSSDEAGKEQEWQWFEAIKQDIGEAFPELKIFQSGGPLHETLLDVLMAYAVYRSDIGYVYGTHVSFAHLSCLHLTNS
jgi:hypothetical protein